jgi:hypothetical protein
MSRCERRTFSLPDVGFCLKGSLGISSRATEHRARIGRPLALKRVYFALTEVMKAGKLAIGPQCSTTSGGLGFFLPALSSVGTVQLNNFSTAATTLPSCLPDASKNISNVSLQGSAPLNSGGPAVLAPFAVLRSHFAAFWMVTSFGLNWKGMLPPALLEKPPPALGSYSLSSALATLGLDALGFAAELSEGAGVEVSPPPAELLSAIGTLMFRALLA